MNIANLIVGIGSVAYVLAFLVSNIIALTEDVAADYDNVTASNVTASNVTASNVTASNVTANNESAKMEFLKRVLR